MKRLAIFGIALAVALMPFATVFAQSAYWEVRVAEPFTDTGGVTNQTSFNFEFKILATDSEDTFNVSLSRNGTPLPASNGIAPDSYARNVSLPSDGTHTFEITVNNNAVADGDRTHTVQVERDTVAPGAANYGQKSQSGNEHTVTFTVTDPDAELVNIYSSTSTTFTANEATKVGEVTPTGTQQSFTYTAGTSERYHAVQVIDDAGNVSPLVGDPDATVTFQQPVSTVSTSTTGAGTGGDGVVIGENGQVIGENGEVIGEDGETLGAQDEDGEASENGDQEGTEDGETLAAADTADDGSNLAWYIILAIIVAGIGYYLWRRRSLNTQ